MKYKINNKYIIDAKNETHAISLYNKFLKDSYIITELGQDYKSNIDTFKRKGLNVDIISRNYDEVKVKVYGPKHLLEKLQDEGYFMYESIKDSDIEYLTQEEEKAVDDYRKAIQNTSNPKLLKLYQHILNEELEHIEELQNTKIEKDIEDDRLSPMTYKKLKEMGYNSDRWKNLTQEEANKIVAKNEKENTVKKSSISKNDFKKSLSLNPETGRGFENLKKGQKVKLDEKLTFGQYDDFFESIEEAKEAGYDIDSNGELCFKKGKIVTYTGQEESTGWPTFNNIEVATDGRFNVKTFVPPVKAEEILKENKIEVVKKTGNEENYYLYFKDLDSQKRAMNILKENYYNVDPYRDQNTKLYKIRVKS